VNYTLMGRSVVIPVLTSVGRREVRYDPATDMFTADDVCYVTRRYMLYAWRESRGRVDPYQPAPITGRTRLRFAEGFWVRADQFRPFLTIGAQMRRRVPVVLRTGK